MADVADVFGFRTLQPSSRTTIQAFQNTPLVNVPAPGDSDTGGIVGIFLDRLGDVIGGRSPILQQFPPAPGGSLPELPGRTGPGMTLGGEILPATGCPTAACCSGFHLNKQRGCDGAPPGSKCVRNRKMNALNPRALRRATRRLKGFERAVKGTRKQLRTLAKI